MAEFCLDCLNRINGTNESEEKYVISRDLDLCEGCGEWKSVVVLERRACFVYIWRMGKRLRSVFKHKK